MKDLPKTIFVRWDEDGNDEPWLNVMEDVADFAVIGETRIIGVYRLVELREIEGVVKNLSVITGMDEEDDDG